MSSFLGVEHLAIGILQKFINVFLFLHTMTFVFIAATCLLKDDCDNDTLIYYAVTEGQSVIIIV